MFGRKKAPLRTSYNGRPVSRTKAARETIRARNAKRAAEVQNSKNKNMLIRAAALKGKGRVGRAIRNKGTMAMARMGNFKNRRKNNLRRGGKFVARGAKRVRNSTVSGAKSLGRGAVKGTKATAGAIGTGIGLGMYGTVQGVRKAGSGLKTVAGGIKKHTYNRGRNFVEGPRNSIKNKRVTNNNKLQQYRNANLARTPSFAGNSATSMNTRNKFRGVVRNARVKNVRRHYA